MAFIHSYWAYLVLAVIIIATANSIIGFVTKREFGAKDFRLALFALIVTHLQLVIGLITYFVSDKVQWVNDELNMKDIMGNADLRLIHVEHPITMIFAIVLLTIGYSKHKKKLVSTPKFKTLSIFYTLALLAVLSRIPWKMWF